MLLSTQAISRRFRSSVTCGPYPINYRIAAASPSREAELSSAGMLGLQLDVVFAPDLADQLQLRLEEVDVFLLALEDRAKQIAGDEVAHALAIGNCLPQLRHRQQL